MEYLWNFLKSFFSWGVQRDVQRDVKYSPDNVLGVGGYGSVFEGSYEGEKVAVKRIQLSNANVCEHEVAIQTKLEHENVLKLLTVMDEGNATTGYKLLVLELCAGTLEQFIKGKFKGPMPTDLQVLYQIACGVDYIHSMNLVHCDIKPDNILISCIVPVVMKVSDFALRKPTTVSEGTCDLAMRGILNWMAPEILQLLELNYEDLDNEQWTVKSDIFSTGCVFFYFIQRGIHPFGGGVLIPANILRNNSVNMEKLREDHFAYDLIEDMIKGNKEERIDFTKVIVELGKVFTGTQSSKARLRTKTNVMAFTDPLSTYRKIEGTNISYLSDTTGVLGSGGFANVYRGNFNGREVAIKRIPINFNSDSRDKEREEREIKLQTGLNHKNVLEILGYEKDEDFRYIVLELCAGTLEDFVEGKYTGLMPSDREVMYQIACGVAYIHSKNLIHRDIKPDNILISLTSPVVMKVSDFGLSKPTSSRGTCDLSGIKGTERWMAPEIMKLQMRPSEIAETRGSIQSDIFSTGCVLFYFIKRGMHPFGKKAWIPENILKNDPVHLKELSKEHFAFSLIENMIKNKKEERIVLARVIELLRDSFKLVKRSFPQLSGDCLSRFHPTDPVLACGSDSSTVTILKGANGSIPFSNWRIKQEFKRQTQSWITALEWNVNGTQLAAGCADGTVIVWSYPSGRVHFEVKKDSRDVYFIAWNPFRQDVLATHEVWMGDEVLFWNSLRENGDAEKANHFLTRLDEYISSVAWISANQIAIGLEKGEIEIWEIDDDKGTSRVVKRFRHGEQDPITWLQWNERTKYLASCSYYGWIKIWSMENDQPVHRLQGRTLAWRRSVKTDNEGGIDDERKDKENFIIACGLDDGSIVIWNPLEEDEVNRKRILPQKHSSWVWSLSFSPDGRFLASADHESQLIIWSTETWLPVFTCKNVGSILSWMSTDSPSSTYYKLAGRSYPKVCVIEQTFTE